MIPAIVGICMGSSCTRQAVSLAYDVRGHGLIPVCRKHILVYRVKADGGWWQAEDEYAGLRFARRSKWRWLAQRRLLADQRALMRGRTSNAQRRLAARRDEATS